MCGIIGSITKENTTLTKEQIKIRGKILSSMALAMQDRGTDSTGLATIKDKKVKIYKKALPAVELIKQKDFKKVVNNDFNIAIGHTRLATIGEVNDKNAHPYKRGNIIGCHNGSVHNWKEWETESKAKVDSEVIFYLLNKNKNNYKKTFGKLDGNFALAWHNLKEPNSLYLATHNNPLFVVRVKELDSVFFLSEEYYLQSIINTAYGLTGKTIFELKDDIVYKINKKLEITKEKVKFDIYDDTYTRYDNYDKYDNYDDWKKDHKETITTPSGKTYALPSASQVEENDFEIQDEIDSYDEEIYWSLTYLECTGCDRGIIAERGFWFNFTTCDSKCSSCMKFTDETYRFYDFINADDYKSIMQDYTKRHKRFEAKVYNDGASYE